MKPLTRWFGVMFFFMILACMHTEKIGNTPFSGTAESYKVEVALKVAKNWAFAYDDNASNQKDEALILLTIDRNGQVKDIAFVKEPMDKGFKASILKAIKQSELFPAFPADFVEDQIQVGIKAVPKGVE